MGLETNDSKLDVLCAELGLAENTDLALFEHYRKQAVGELAEKLGLNTNMTYEELRECIKDPNQISDDRLIAAAKELGLKREDLLRGSTLMCSVDARTMNLVEEKAGLAPTPFNVNSFLFGRDIKIAGEVLTKVLE